MCSLKVEAVRSESKSSQETSGLGRWSIHKGEVCVDTLNRTELSEDWIHYERYVVAVNIGKFELWAADRHEPQV